MFLNKIYEYFTKKEEEKKFSKPEGYKNLNASSIKK